MFGVNLQAAILGFCIGYCDETSIPEGMTTIKIEEGGRRTTIYQPARSRDSQHNASPFSQGRPPLRLTFHNGDDQLMGGATQIDPSAKVFVTARHVIAGKQAITLKAYRNGRETPVDPRSFRWFQASSPRGEGWLDLLVAVRTSEKGNEDLQTLNGEDLMERIQEFIGEPVPTRPWYSWQFSLLNSQMLSGKTAADSLFVNAERPERDQLYFWLNKPRSNFTGAGSSGSVVWQGDIDNIEDLRPIGLVQCIEKPNAHEVISRTEQTAKPRVLSFAGLLNGGYRLQEVSVQQLIKGEPQKIDPNCTPIDRRNGGGP